MYQPLPLQESGEPRLVVQLCSPGSPLIYVLCLCNEIETD